MSAMIDLDRLRYLASPDAERMSDYQRLNEFVKFGLEAADEIERLRALSPPEPTEGRKLMPLEPTDEALLNGARSIGLTIGMENHIERARHCYRAFMSDDRQPIPTGRPLPLQDRSKP